MAILNIIESFIAKEYLLLFVLITVTYTFNFYYKYFTRPNPLPGPLPLPLIGNLHNVGFDLRNFYKECRQKYGELCEIMILGDRCIILTRPDYIEKVVSPTSKKDAYLKRQPHVSQGIIELGSYGYGIINNDVYNNWRYNRQFFTQAILAPKFMNTAIKSANNLYEEFSEYWQSLGRQCNNNNDNNDNDNNWALEIDFSKWFHAYANEFISILTTGERTYSMASVYNSQSNIKSKYPNALVDDGDKFTESLVDFIGNIAVFIFFGKFIRQYVPIVKDRADSALKKRDYLFGKLDMIIKKRREEIEEMPEGTEMKTDMLTSLIISNTIKDSGSIKTIGGETFKPMNDEEIRGNLFDAFLGGTDTTANAFSFITYYLCKHPQVKQKVVSEIDTIFTKSFKEFCITHDALTKLKYCEAVIKETLRIMTVVSSVTRCVTEECEVGGYKWPAGTLFHINNLAANEHPEFWHNPEVFDPDRFYKNDKNDKNDKKGDKTLLTMFGGGLRICPGRKLAMTELLSLMAAVYKNYNFDLVNMHEPLNINLSGVVTNCVEMKVRISPRI